RQVPAQGVAVHRRCLGRVAPAEQGEEGVVVQAADGGALQFEQGVLDGVDVHRVDLPGAGEEVVEGVAAGAGDDQDAVVGGEVEGGPVQGRVLPARVVDEVAAVDRLEDPVVEALAGGKRGHLHGGFPGSVWGERSGPGSALAGGPGQG